MGALEGRMSELAAELAAVLQGAKIDLLSVGSADGRLSTLNSNFARSIRELNDDAQRLLSQPFGALVEERRSPDGGWHQEQEFHRFFEDGGKTWRECSMLKSRVPSEYQPYKCDLVKRGRPYTR